MDAIVLLKNDHKVVEKLFKQYQKAGAADTETKREIAEQVLRALTEHAFIEEQIFYPAAREALPETTDHVLESVEEHHVVAWLLSEISQVEPDDERYDAKMTVLIENVRHHVQEEEQDWFPQVRKALGRKRLQELGDEMERAKSQAPANPLDLASAKS